MGALAILVLSVAALDSLNPSTLGPAVVLALGDRAALRVAAFTAGVFLVSTVGGLIVLFVLGRAVLARVAHPSAHTQHLLELAVGVVLLVAAALLWVFRGHLRTHLRRGPSGGGRSSFVLGAGIMAVELPTAFPYYAAILATVGAVDGALGQAIFVVFYNVVFVAPLALLAAVVALTGDRYRGRIARLSDTVARHGPVVLPIGVACIGVALVVVGAVGL